MTPPLRCLDRPTVLLRALVLLTLVICSATTGHATAQSSDTFESAVATSVGYATYPDIVYQTADGYEARLDVYRPRGSEDPAPTLLLIHGGGWVGGTKEATALRALPFLQRGWAVVNVEYRLARVALAPAAVEDVLCALRWTIRNAEDYDIDPDRIVVTGYSAGGHLSLTTGMTPASAGLDRRCPGSEPLQVAAVVNWFGITDVGDLLDGENMKSYAVQWLGGLEDRHEVADRVSPLTWVRAELPPILTIHGDADPVVPYSHAVRLHDALDQAGVPNRLHTVPDGGHGNFSVEEHQEAFRVIRDFLREHGLW